MCKLKFNTFGSKLLTMKKTILFFTSILTFGLNAQTNPSQDFENWFTHPNYPAQEPVGWISTNVLTNSFASASNPTSITQSTVSCNGPSSMRVETKKFTLGLLTGFLPDTCGFAFTGGVLISLNPRLVDGIGYTQRPTQITYCYHALPQPMDTCGVSVLFWKWTGSARNYIGGAKNLYPTATTGMTNATLSIAYSSTVTPDSMCIYVGSSYKFATNGTSIRKGAKIGSVMYVDNFGYPSVGLNENTSREISLVAYPNPASTIIYVATESVEAKSIEISDLTGKVLERINFADGKLKIDATKYNSGLYLYSVMDSSKQSIKTGKFTVTH